MTMKELLARQEERLKLAKRLQQVSERAYGLALKSKQVHLILGDQHSLRAAHRNFVRSTTLALRCQQVLAGRN